MNTPETADRKWNERGNAAGGQTTDNSTFRLLFERSADPIWLFDPASGVFVDCNQAAVELVRSGTREQLLRSRPSDLAPPCQPDGQPSEQAAQEIAAVVEQQGGHRFEWLCRRLDGTEVLLEVVSTPIYLGSQSLHVVVSRDISERKNAEAALRESQQLLASVADNISEGIHRSDAQHRLTFANHAYLKMFGFSSLEELQSIPRDQLVAKPDLRRELLTILDQQGAFRDQEVEYVRKDGSRFWGLASARVIRDASTGKVLYHVGVVTDITERKQAEDEIRELNQSLERRIIERTAALSASEARARLLVEHAPEAIVVFDGATGRFVSGNENALQLYGVSREALVELTPADVSPEYQPNGRTSAELAREMIQEALQGKMPVFEWFHRHSSGRLIPCEVRLLRLPNEQQELVRASIIDNSFHRRRERIQQATYQISEAVHTANDLDQLYTQIHYIIMGLMPAQNFYIALYDPVTELIRFVYHVDEITDHPLPCPVGTGLTGTVLRSGQPLLVGREMNAHKRRIGNEVTFEGYQNIRYSEYGKPSAIWLGVPLTIQGKPIGVMAVQDYHNDQAYGEEEKRILSFVAMQTALAIERKRTEQALRVALERERELSVMKSNFVSLVSHEFRTPLGIIMSSAEILDHYFDQVDPEERKSHLESIQKSTRRMAELMEDVLFLARFDAGKLDFQPGEIQLPLFFERIIDEVLSATHRRCPIQLRIGSLQHNGYGDVRLLEHIFVNLLNNAVKYSEPGIPVEFNVEQTGKEAVCVIRDRGIGIPESDQQWLFQAFHRGKNVGQRPGTGLGLVVVQRCIERHGGSIQVESQIGQGTTMTVRLPICPQTFSQINSQDAHSLKDHND